MSRSYEMHGSVGAMSAFKIKVGTIARLIACDNCDNPVEDPCSHGRNNYELVEVVKQYEHEDPAMETPCYEVRVFSSGEDLDGVRLWDLVRLTPLEELAAAAK